MALVAEHAGDDRQSQQGLAGLFQPLGHHVWRDRDGQAVTHTIYALLGCPAPLSARWLLVHRAPDGSRRILAAGHTESDVASVNLAVIRHRGAGLGANEVHLADLGDHHAAGRLEGSGEDGAAGSGEAQAADPAPVAAP